MTSMPSRHSNPDTFCLDADESTFRASTAFSDLLDLCVVCQVATAYIEHCFQAPSEHVLLFVLCCTRMYVVFWCHIRGTEDVQGRAAELCRTLLLSH